MKNRIINFLKDPKYKPQNLEAIAAFLSVSKKEVALVLNELKEEGFIFEGKNKNILLTSKYGLVVGQVSRILKRMAVITYIDNDDNQQDVLIERSKLAGALYQDRVLVDLNLKKEEASIYKIIKFHNDSIVGEFVDFNPNYIIPDNQNYDIDIFIPKGKSKGARKGHKVVVNIIERGKRILGEVVEIIGHTLDPKVDIISKAYELGVPTKFKKEVLESVEDLPFEVEKIDLIDRKDLTNNLIVTIDGEDAKDIDDAIEIRKNSDGTYYLGVHIADVSHYVGENTLLDLEAQERGTSVYLTDYVIPMLPHALSNGICSLNEGSLRLTMSVEMMIDQKGEVIDYNINPSFIISKKRLTYKEVNELLNNQKSIDPKIDEMLQVGLELSTILSKKFYNRGYLELGIKEAKIIVDSKGKPIDIEIRESNLGEKLIENFMITTNEIVATHIFHQNLPFIYRTHESPQLKKIEIFSEQIKSIGYRIKKERNEVHVKEIQELLERIKTPLEKSIIASLLLRSLPKAKYDINSVGHFGLGSECYTHFTAPIRRYPDLLVHRYLKRYREYDDSFNYESHLSLLDKHALNSSILERRAMQLERAVEDMKKAEYMESKIGATFEGRVSSILKTGFFVELDNTIEGFIRYENLDDDYYNYDSKRLIAIGERTKKVIKLGDLALVKVKAADKRLSTVDFVLMRFGKKKRGG